MGEIPDLPPYRRAKGDRNLLASLALSRYVMRMLRSPDLDALDTARSQAQDWLASMPHLHTASDQELLDWLATFPPRQAASMRRLLHYSGLASRREVCSTAFSTAPACRRDWPTASSAAPVRSTPHSSPSGCGRWAASWPHDPTLTGDLRSRAH